MPKKSVSKNPKDVSRKDDDIFENNALLSKEIEKLKKRIEKLKEEVAKEKRISRNFYDVAVDVAKNHQDDIENHFEQNPDDVILCGNCLDVVENYDDSDDDEEDDEDSDDDFRKTVKITIVVPKRA